jgi:hypothetical protein
MNFCTNLIFYAERLAPRPTPKVEHHPWSFVQRMHSQIPSIAGGHPSICNLTLHHAAVTRDPPNMDQQTNKTISQTCAWQQHHTNIKAASGNYKRNTDSFCTTCSSDGQLGIKT